MKSYFTFSKEQRNGIFLLILLIIILQCVCFFINKQPKNIVINQEELAKFQKEIDSLKVIELQERKPKQLSFNPNYITDYKGASLGMSNEEIDRLHAFRKYNKWINSTKEFQQITKISDSLLKAISPYFKFPDWVANPRSKTNSTFYNNTPKTFAQKQDLNTATVKQLQKVKGVGEYYSERIVNFRNKFLGGFIADIQLQDVYGLTPELIEKITEEFTVKTPRSIKKINVNKADIEELVTIQHIDYDLAYQIVEQRKLRDGYKALDELTKVKDFPVNKIEIIKLYLHLEKEN
ncbi:helix-hairpin-helix domain-containing protein [Sabulilitoribacter arenilitoris]|uniref:Helix-hairpin-helix domain-containing protein n=1 Tax=Wocania arenilitoris TaxID=2044858 RepID=A0AAE3ERM0_9FLAO|nr:helix-hairpin-helix domain-containing protein [Wocania arenilitoris]MCF7569517.1 helix-hairpin-helix domain-containing protein [Wocania arenilitoris]